MADIFVYQSYKAAVDDLKLFSGMFMNEDKLLFLVVLPSGGHIIQKNAQDGDSARPSDTSIVAIALNGRVFE